MRHFLANVYVEGWHVLKDEPIAASNVHTAASRAMKKAKDEPTATAPRFRHRNWTIKLVSV